MSSTSPSELFKLVEAGDRVWAAISMSGETVGNAAIVDLGGRVLVVDTFLTPRPAADLRQAALDLTGAEAAWVVNTHFHNDHCGGNEIFAAAARIASTEGTRDRILERKAALPDRIAEVEARLAELGGGEAAGGKGRAADPEIERQREELAHEVEVLRRMRVVAPEATFTDRLTIRGERRRVEVVAVGAAHTFSDAVVHLPEERILISGDVVLNGVHPWVGDGDIKSWIEVLGRLSGMAAETVVPGHGEVGRASAIADMADYMRDLLGLVEAAVAAAPGAAPEDLPVPEIPERWRSLYMPHTWPGDFPAAVRAGTRPN